MLVELGSPPHPSMGTAGVGAARHPPGELGTHGWLLPVPAISAGGARPPTHQLDAGGVAVPALRALLQHIGGSWLQREHRCNESWGLAGPLGPGLGWVLPKAAPTSLAPPAQPHRGPVDEPVRLLLAVDDDAVALPPLLGRPARAKAAGRRWHPAPKGAPAPSAPGGAAVPGRARTHRSCSRACITTKSHMWLIRLCRRL